MSFTNDPHTPSPLSLQQVLKGLVAWYRHLWSQRKKIALGTLLVLLLTLSYNYLKSPVYAASTTFVLEHDQGPEMGGGLSSLISLSGINLSGMMGGGTLFQIDNIQQLYRSHNMLRKTFLSKANIQGTEVLLLARFAQAEKLDKKWAKKQVYLQDFSQGAPLTRAQDSVLKTAIKTVTTHFLRVAKPGRKTTILELGFDHQDEGLAKAFNETLVRNVSQFYQQTKTLKTATNLRMLQQQTDSIKQALDTSLDRLARLDEALPNPNPLVKTSRLPYQKALVDVQTHSAIYQEVAKQLELAKVAHRNRQPLIQPIDQPVLPLEHNRWKFLKTLFIGLFAGFLLMVLGLSLERMIREALASDPSQTKH